MKKLVKIRLINWHYLSNETIELEGNTLLSGPNASGKSTIMDAITYILTAGDTMFNLAANEKGKRDLRGYVKCKLGMDDKEYLRNGDVSGHVALEFYDEKTDSKFAVGAVIDAFGELLPVKTLFYRTFEPINDSMFVSEEHQIYGTVDFRKHNSNFEFYLTKKDAKRGFRTAFGSINEDFYRLIPKALAFKPITDVKDFIYQNILEEKEIDVSAIKDSIRSYKELENTLKLINKKITDLKEIDGIYQELKGIEERKNYIEYLMHLFDTEAIRGEITDAKRQIEKQEALRVMKEQEIHSIEQELLALNERSRDLYNALSNNDTFKAEEYINREILKTQTNITALEANQQSFLKRASIYKDTVNDLRKISNEKLFQEMANVSLVQMNSMDVESSKLKLKDFQARLTSVQNKMNQELGSLDAKKRALVAQINEISTNLKGLDQNRVNFPTQLLQIRAEIEEGLKRIYNYDVKVHIFAEICEITNQTWADTVEIFLGNRRFNMIVEPRYFDQALQIFSRIKSRYRLYGIGLVNTKQISKFKAYKPNSLASIIDSENQDARCYINYVAGNVIMCNDAMELENYETSITNDLLIYRGYAVTSLNPNVEKPFIGKNAASKQAVLWHEKADVAKNEYLALNHQIEELNQILSLIDRIDVRPIVEDLDKALSLEKEKHTLEDLSKQAIRQKNATPSELEEDYEKILETIKAYDVKKLSLSKEIGGIDNAIDALNGVILSKTNELTALEAELKELSGDSVVIEQRAKDEYTALVETKNFKAAFSEYQEKYKTEEASFTLLSDTLVARQYAYINTYNSTFSIGLSEIDKFMAELNKLEKTELIKYEQKVRSARESAEIVFKEDFIAKLRNNILTAEQEIYKINETLSNITFGNDRYEFIFPRSSEYASFYEMVTSDLENNSEGLLTLEFQQKYDQQIRELFETLSMDEVNSNGAINKFTDYRTYMDYDIRIINKNGDTMSYSKVFKEKSGGETQVPFYVAIIASFVRVYTKNSVVAGDPIGLVLFDEVFDKMDANRMHAMMSFINSMPLQVIIACPPQRMDILQEFAKTTLIMVRQGTRATVLPMLKKEEDEE
ncbi:MAG: AAA family ATPase [Anaeroplasmataceae bacterium]|nr:AAA family ATPase [Anaeroplasmataceae bacterium]